VGSNPIATTKIYNMNPLQLFLLSLIVGWIISAVITSYEKHKEELCMCIRYPLAIIIALTGIGVILGFFGSIIWAIFYYL
jgi:hypothetical protein